MTKIYPFILSGGSGTRLWPLSRKAYPKQFLSDLYGENSLFQQTCERVRGALFENLSVLTNEEHRFIVAEQLRNLAGEPDKIIVEPVARNTAPAALIAALHIVKNDKDGLLLLLPSDHAIADTQAFEEAITKGLRAVQSGDIVIFGVSPASPHTGYGYIQTCNEDADILSIKKFTEKPNKQMAEAFIKDGNYFWNAGIFLTKAETLIDAFKDHAPDLVAHCTSALDKAQVDLDFLHLDNEAFSQSEAISLDYAIIEKIQNLKCVSLKTLWNDLGEWPAIWDVSEKDENGNVANGDALFFNTKNSYIHSQDGACVALIGMEDVFAVAVRDAILLAPKSQAQDVKEVVETLQKNGREETIYHNRVHRPWGWYERLVIGDRYQVKCIMVKPGGRLSLQSHVHRAEHWVVVEGTAEVTIGDEKKLLTENQSTYISIGEVHRLANPGKLPTMMVEVQSGAYLGEDDIVRYEDVYGRD